VRLTGLALLLCLLFPGSVRPDEMRLQVMLQGSDIDSLERTVIATGGEVSHVLPIISAIGARMTADQLAQVQADAGTLERTIDDLAWEEPEPDPREGEDCPLAGHIELTWEGPEARWTLYNKGSRAFSISTIQLSWPEPLGNLQGAWLADRPLSWRLTESPADAPQPRHAAIDGDQIEPRESATLRLRFARTHPDPRRVQSDIALRASGRDGCSSELVPAYARPDEDSYFPTVSGAASLQQYGVTGRGVTVAVLDSGLWEDNPALTRDTNGAGRIIARYDAIAGQEVELAVDESGHGTHITSVIARSDRTTRAMAAQPSYRGIAPNAGIVVVKAFRRDGQADLLDLVRGVQWIVDHREEFGIRIVNLSFAARPRWPYWQDPLNQALMQAWAAGLFIVAAAGNEGPEPMSVGSPGNLPYLLTVGALTDSWTEGDRNDDYIPDFSSRGPTPMGHIKPDLVAPGGHIAGITRSGSSLAEEFPEYFLGTGEFVMTGSSQAAAVMSGLAALILELEPEFTNDELKCLFITSAEPAIERDGRLSYSPFVQGGGAANARRALTLGQTRCDQQDLKLEADIAGPEHYIGPAIFHDDRAPSLPGEARIVAPRSSTEGPSPSRRWGINEHLQRLPQNTAEGPIDWQAILRAEQARIRALSTAR